MQSWLHVHKENVMRVVVGGIDISNYIVSGSYSVNASDQYESWMDGNGVEHRIIVRSKVSGSFEIGCCDKTITLSDFLAAWESAVNNGVVTMGCTVLNTGKFEALEAYYTITGKDHIKKGDGQIIDIMSVKIQER